MPELSPSFLALKKPQCEAVYYREAKNSDLEFHFVDFQNAKPIKLQLEEVDRWANEKWFYQSAPAILRQEDYFKSLDSLVKHLAKAKQAKVVFSRAQLFDLALEPMVLFDKLCNAYPEATVYLFSHPTSGTWLGASPETLLAFKEDRVETASLAATLPLNSEQDFGEKEKLEQEIVTHYILATLQSISALSQVKKGSLEIVRAGNLRHLYTAIKASSSLPLPLDELLGKLHPTPAVAGNPKAEALELISQLEQYDRSYYTGYFGLKNSDAGHFWVNLRCAQIISPTQICLYAGGGIIAASEPQSEWQETKNKMQTILNVMQ